MFIKLISQSKVKINSIYKQSLNLSLQPLRRSCQWSRHALPVCTRYVEPNVCTHIITVNEYPKFYSTKGRNETSAQNQLGDDLTEPLDEKPSLFKRFKAMYRDYWYVLIPVHVVTSVGWFVTFYYIAESGVDLVAIAESLHLGPSLTEKLKDGGHSITGYLAIAYAMYKIATPLRYTVTLGGTTLSINYLKKYGYIKPIPKKAELKKMLEDRRDSLKEKKQAMTSYMVQKLSQNQKKN